MRNIVWLDHPAAREPALVGRKAARLSRCAADYAVPPGFCIPAPALERALGESWAAGSQPPRIPAALCDELAIAYAGLAARTSTAQPRVAVRASAVDEMHGTAREYATSLNIAGSEPLAAAVCQSWWAARSAAARERGHTRKATGDDARPAVLVQQFVDAEISAIVWSTNPLGRRDEMVIYASWGLGTSMTTRNTMADLYVAHKTDGALVARLVSEKHHMIVAALGGTHEIAVPEQLRTHPTLAEAQVADLARLARALERQCAYPIRAACAYQDSRMYLLGYRRLHTPGASASLPPILSTTHDSKNSGKGMI